MTLNMLMLWAKLKFLSHHGCRVVGEQLCTDSSLFVDIWPFIYLHYDTVKPNISATIAANLIIFGAKVVV
jgi:hypothetical protein